MSDINNNSIRYRRTITGYFLAFTAVITCPCHLPILIVLLSGSAAGAFYECSGITGGAFYFGVDGDDKNIRVKWMTW